MKISLRRIRFMIHALSNPPRFRVCQRRKPREERLRIGNGGLNRSTARPEQRGGYHPTKRIQKEQSLIQMVTSMHMQATFAAHQSSKHKERHWHSPYGSRRGASCTAPSRQCAMWGRRRGKGMFQQERNMSKATGHGRGVGGPEPGRARVGGLATGPGI